MKYNKSKSEFEREAVPENQLKSWKSFLGMYSGEHTAGTEFMIGPLFLTVGVSAFDLLAGLFLGNLMAVLSWRFMTADLAVKERFTLYCYHYVVEEQLEQSPNVSWELNVIYILYVK